MQTFWQFFPIQKWDISVVGGRENTPGAEFNVYYRTVSLPAVTSARHGVLRSDYGSKIFGAAERERKFTTAAFAESYRTQTLPLRAYLLKLSTHCNDRLFADPTTSRLDYANSGAHK